MKKLICILIVLLCFAKLVKASDIEKKNVVVSTTIIYDLVKNIAGDTVNVSSIMKPGSDPHSYQASAGDVMKLQKADIVIVQGLHLEGRMGKALEGLNKIGKPIISIENGIDKSKLLTDEDGRGIVDPHIWFDVDIWMDAAKYVSLELSEFCPEYKDIYSKNLEKYLAKLNGLHEYAKEQILNIPKESRVMITAHDAFRYFAKAYGIEVKGIQGISTDSEVSTGTIASIAQYIKDKKIKSIFLENSVSDKSQKALLESVSALGFTCDMGGTLYSDSLGDENSGADTYEKMFKKNVDTIVSGLK